MKNYVLNLWLWVKGFTLLGTLEYRGTFWSAKTYAPVYLIDVGLNVLSGGAVCTLSRRFQEHRAGWVWDKILDVIEKFDKDHGPKAGGAEWGSVESPKSVQVVTGVLVLLALWFGGKKLWAGIATLGVKLWLMFA